METAGFIIRSGGKRTTKLESTFGEWVREKKSKRKNMETNCKKESGNNEALNDISYRNWGDGARIHRRDTNKPSSAAVKSTKDTWRKWWEWRALAYQWLIVRGWFFAVMCSLHFPTSLLFVGHYVRIGHLTTSHFVKYILLNKHQITYVCLVDCRPLVR